jgi:hypothetical protein
VGCPAVQAIDMGVLHPILATVLQARVTRFSGANEGVHDSCEDAGRDHDRIDRMAERKREPRDGREKKEDDSRRSRRAPESVIKPPPRPHSTAIAESGTIAPFDALGSSRVQARRCAMRYDDDVDDLPCFRAIQ